MIRLLDYVDKYHDRVTSVCTCYIDEFSVGRLISVKGDWEHLLVYPLFFLQGRQFLLLPVHAGFPAQDFPSEMINLKRKAFATQKRGKLILTELLPLKAYQYPLTQASVARHVNTVGVKVKPHKYI